MSKLQATLNVVFALAIAFLVILYFAGEGTKGGSADETKPKIALKNLPKSDTAQGGSIVFVNSDTLLEKYKYYKQTKSVLDGKVAKLEQELDGRMRALEQQYIDAQTKVRNNQMSESMMQEVQTDLMRKQQELQEYKSRQQQKLMEEEQGATKKLNDEIKNYLKEIGQQYGYRYILGYSNSGGILYASDTLDITSQVVDGLNARYSKATK